MFVVEWAASAVFKSQVPFKKTTCPSSYYPRVCYLQPTSGAIDVVAVRKADGKIECSPFHVKLINATRNRERSRVVRLKVNGLAVPVSMKVGPAGEAFFVERTRERVGRDLRTSPPGSPIPSQASKRLTPPLDIPPLDIENVFHDKVAKKDSAEQERSSQQ